MKRKAIIIGAGPAGLTAAYELLKRTDIVPIVLEKSGDIGGISKTVNYKGNRIDIGGHRFFSKSDRVMNWWFNMMPVQGNEGESFRISYQNKSREVGVNGDAGADPDNVMLVRNRLSRIYFLRKFFTYPIQLSLDTLRKLGVWTTLSIMFSYLKIQLFPRKPEKNLEDFMINRFGTTLYRLFFKDYTEKVWGIPCDAISAEWGAQRIKGVSIKKAIQHAIQSAGKRKQPKGDISQKDTETSLIEQFLYPKFGPGQLWEEVARQVEAMGGKILMHHDVKRIYTSDGGDQITAVAAINNITGETSYLDGDFFFSTMPVQELIGGMDGVVPADVRHVAAGLQYRDFITVGILLKRLSFQDKKTGEWMPLELKDTWIYIQEKDVKVGRLQLFNNWSPFMVKDPDTVWVGMEFFCNKTDGFWQMPDIEIQRLAINELERIGLACEANVLDATVLRMEKTYPAYFGTYERFDAIREYIDRFENLFLVGRNGMHKYNNSDHSMLTAMVAVDNICAGVKHKTNIWAINTEQEYHEEKTALTEPEKVLQPVTTEKLGSFKNFVFQNRLNRIHLLCGAIALVIQFVVFKYFYPFASFINGDSYVYLETAYHNFSINTYPVGYSNFVRLFSVFTKSDTALVFFQYFSLHASLLGFLFTIFYFYQPGKVVQRFLLAFFVLNPVFLYLANYVSSDTLFLALSVLWFTVLLWLVHLPSWQLVIWHAVILFLAFTVRYNALFYPVITALAFLLSRHRVSLKIVGTGLGVLLIGSFIIFTSYQYKKLTGTWQFSPFTGWQMANNAMYAYRYVDSVDRKQVPPRFRVIDKMVRTYFDTTRDVKIHLQEQLVASTVYMWDPVSPLRLYMADRFKKDSVSGELKRWATVGPLYGEYGSYLMRLYPLTFVRHYLWPNTMKYYSPPVEFLEQYSTGVDSVQQVAQIWFDYKSRKITSRFKSFDVNVLNFLPILAGTLNVLFLFGLFAYWSLGGWKNTIFKKGIVLSATFWLVNFGFSVFAAPIALRFQLFPIIISISFTAMFVEYIVRAAMRTEEDLSLTETPNYQLLS